MEFEFEPVVYERPVIRFQLEDTETVSVEESPSSAVFWQSYASFAQALVTCGRTRASGASIRTNAGRFDLWQVWYAYEYANQMSLRHHLMHLVSPKKPVHLYVACSYDNTSRQELRKHLNEFVYRLAFASSEAAALDHVWLALSPTPIPNSVCDESVADDREKRRYQVIGHFPSICFESVAVMTAFVETHPGFSVPDTLPFPNAFDGESRWLDVNAHLCPASWALFIACCPNHLRQQASHQQPGPGWTLRGITERQ